MYVSLVPSYFYEHESGHTSYIKPFEQNELLNARTVIFSNNIFGLL